MYHQHYNPLGNVLLSTIAAAIPILVLLYFIALHPHRDKTGVKHLGISAPYAAFYGVLAAFLISCLVFAMPFKSAFSAFAYGSLSGFLGIIWIVLAAMFLYTMTVITGKFEIVKESIIHISFDRRLQVLLIAFSFGAIIEGTSGFGTPVAIAGAIMVGLGFSPFEAAVLNLLANTAPVAYGAIGTPIVTLAAVSGLDQLTLSSMAGQAAPLRLGHSALLARRHLRFHAQGQVEGRLGGMAGYALLRRILCLDAVRRVPDERLPPDDGRRRGRLLGHLHRPLPALRLASQDALPPCRRRVRSRGSCGVCREKTACQGPYRRVEVSLHGRPDCVCLGALGHPHLLLRRLGHALLEELSQRPVRERQVPHDFTRLSLHRDALLA